MCSSCNLNGYLGIQHSGVMRGLIFLCANCVQFVVVIKLLFNLFFLIRNMRFAWLDYGPLMY